MSFCFVRNEMDMRTRRVRWSDSKGATAFADREIGSTHNFSPTVRNGRKISERTVSISPEKAYCRANNPSRTTGVFCVERDGKQKRSRFVGAGDLRIKSTCGARARSIFSNRRGRSENTRAQSIHLSKNCIAKQNTTSQWTGVFCVERGSKQKQLTNGSILLFFLG